ncbi:MAG: polymorphic toxin-type HINT domain-containing protein [Pirellulales bacterium]|nr:polymorphic toxin-type HINT domain-containing protein [Pirellulales bacterium]
MFARSCFAAGPVIGWVVMMVSHGTVPGSHAAEVISNTSNTNQTIQAALAAAQAGEFSKRTKILNEALAKTPNDPLLRSQLGYLRMKQKWITVEDYLRTTKPPATLAEYQRLRDQTAATPAGQLALADFCAKHGLPDQERVHLTRVLELEPEHAAAHQRLGHVMVGQPGVDGQWFTPEELAAARADAKAVAAAYQRHHAQLETVYAKFQNGKLSHEQTVAELLTITDPAIVPTWELIFSTASPEGAGVVIAALAKTPWAESSQSLVRHALFANTPELESAAVNALKGRDWHTFIPALLAELKGPVLASMELTVARGGKLIYRQSYFADGQNKQQLAVFDHTFYCDGEENLALDEAGRQARAASAARDQVRQARNQSIDEHNRRVMQMLAMITESTGLDSPQDWWRWWNDVNEVYTTGEKSLYTSYKATKSAVVIAPPEITEYVTELEKDLKAKKEHQRKQAEAEKLKLEQEQWKRDMEKIREKRIKESGFVDVSGNTSVDSFGYPVLSRTAGSNFYYYGRSFYSDGVNYYVDGQLSTPAMLAVFGVSTSCSCLPAGTPITTSTGLVAIDRIKAGDLVLAQDTATGALGWRPVLKTTTRDPQPLFHILCGAETIRATGGHPFWVVGTGWVKARELQPGMVLHGLKVTEPIRSVELVEKPVKTFNLVVEDDHNYFVGQQQVLSHDITIREGVSAVVPGVGK